VLGALNDSTHEDCQVHHHVESGAQVASSQMPATREAPKAAQKRYSTAVRTKEKFSVACEDQLEAYWGWSPNKL